MMQIIGYIVKKDGDIILATGDERKALYVAREWKGISYKVVTTINPLADPTTERTIAYDGTK